MSQKLKNSKVKGVSHGFNNLNWTKGPKRVVHRCGHGGGCGLQYMYMYIKCVHLTLYAYTATISLPYIFQTPPNN